MSLTPAWRDAIDGRLRVAREELQEKRREVLALETALAADWQHKAATLLPDPAPLRCPYCGHETKSWDASRLHMRKAHPRAPRNPEHPCTRERE